MTVSITKLLVSIGVVGVALALMFPLIEWFAKGIAWLEFDYHGHWIFKFLYRVAFLTVFIGVVVVTKLGLLFAFERLL